MQCFCMGDGVTFSDIWSFVLFLIPAHSEWSNNFAEPRMATESHSDKRRSGFCSWLHLHGQLVTWVGGLALRVVGLL